MLLAIDIGNSQTVIGLFQGERLIKAWRIRTVAEETAAEKAVALANLLALEGYSFKDLTALIFSSVVPASSVEVRKLFQDIVGLKFLEVNAGLSLNIKVKYCHPEEIGPDRLVNAVAAFKRFQAPLIVVDFGTATTLDIITRTGTYVGGVIIPGVETAAKALFKRAARLFPVELKPPKQVIGKDTESSVQSGLIFGTAKMVDGLIALIEQETKEKYEVVATGGLASLITPFSARIKLAEPNLTLFGLADIWLLNKERLA
jgi:type III pantothenate kinase